jgi:hypothetical protein
MNLRPDELPPDLLLFDPNNFRFQDRSGFVHAQENRFAEESVQARAYQRIREEPGISELKRSILRNGFLTVERLIVRPYQQLEDRVTYLVLEGNRRLACVNWILEDHEAGVNVPEDVLISIRRLPVLIAETEPEDEREFFISLMGIRHVGGIRQWGGYQRAKLIAEMRDDLNLEAQDVADRLGLSTHEVNRRYRAFNALRQMQESEDYAEYAVPELYPLFHEAVSQPTVKDWLEWDDARCVFADDTEREKFYSLITPSTDENERVQEPKIASYSHVRELKHILPKGDAKKILLDQDRDFQEAIAVARRDEFAKMWINEVSEAIASLKDIGIDEMKRIGEDERVILEQLRDVAQERLSDIEKLAD